MRLIVALIWLPFFCLGQSRLSVSEEIKPYFSLNGKTFDKAEKFDRYINRLEDARSNFSNDSNYLKFVFDQVHERWLKSFDKSATFPEIFEHGKFNCLTATALYSAVLNAFNFDHEIIETSNHIFLLVECKDRTVLIESTDPVNGFISDAGLISDRIQRYQDTQILSANRSIDRYEFQTSVFSRVEPLQLIGLMHFNLATLAYNNRDVEKAIDHVISAEKYYKSKRIDDLSQIIMLTVAQSKLSREERIRLVKKLQENRSPQLIAHTDAR